MKRKITSESLVRDIKGKTRRKFSSEEKIRIVVDGLCGETSIAELCRIEGIAQKLYYRLSTDFIEPGKMVRPCQSQATEFVLIMEV